MLLEAAMSELREDASSLMMLPDEIQSNISLNPGKIEGQMYPSAMHKKEEPGVQSNSDNAGICHDNGEVSLLQDDHSKRNSVCHSSSNASYSVTSPYDINNAGSSVSCPYDNNNHGGISFTSPYDSNNHGGISLLQEDNEFVSRVLNREPSNLGSSSRFGSYRSTAAVAAEGIPFQWEAEPGKSKNPTIKEEVEELPPLSLPPIRLSSTHMPPHMSPSSSAAPSPRSLTGKMKSLIINHVKKPSMDHFSFTSNVEPQKNPSKKPPYRSKRERKTSSLSASEYGSMQSSFVTNSPYIYSAPFKNGNMQKNEESCAPTASLNSSSDPCSSPYYFSPLSNASSLMSQGIMSLRASIAQSSSGSIISNSYSHAYRVGSHTSSRCSDSSVSSISSAPGNAPSNGPAMLANCLLSITSMSDDQMPPAESENGDQNGSNSLSFASPEMEIIDEGLLTSADYMDSMQQSKPDTTMEDFINRGGPSMNRSFSTSRVTFADDLYRKPAPKAQYYSAQLSNLAQPKSTHPSSTQDPIHYTAKLDVLFPLKRPNGVEFASKYINQSEESPDDRQAYVDALDTSLDCSVMTDNEELNSMVQSIMNDHIMKEKPAHEVVMEANDENGFAYSPVASAFVFSPKKASQNAAAAKHYFKPSTRANISNNASNGSNHSYNGVHIIGQPKSILKKTCSQELSRAASFNVKTAGRDLPALSMCAQQKSFRHSGPLKSDSSALYSGQQKSLTPSGSQKISSVLLRFAEAEEQLYNNSKRHHGGMRSPAACMQPMCSFLGRALLCRSKLGSHAGHVHT